MKKKIFAAAVMMCMVLAVTACGKNNTAEAGTRASVQTENVKAEEETQKMEGIQAAEETQKMESIQPAGNKNEMESKNEAAEMKDKEISSEEATLKELAAMLGASDDEVKGLFGGGTENWTSDKTILIGRLYQSKLFGKAAAISTMNDEHNKVNVVQAQVSEISAADCQQQITAATGAAMEAQGTGEGGQSRSQWSWNGMLIDLYPNGDVVTIELFIPIE